jgi:cullin-associated NEDD8-dissociated protein 1
MGAMDLCNEMLKISETSKIEESVEKRIIAAFIKHLNDSSIDVQSNAVKCIQKTASILREQYLRLLVESLSDMVVDSNKKEVRDIYSLAIRSTIQELKETAAADMIKAVYPKLSRGLKSGNDEVKEECLDILAEICKKFGSLLYKKTALVNKDELMKQLCDLLKHTTEGVRKRATYCLGQFAIILSSKQLQQLMNLLIDRLQKAQGDKQDLLVQIQCISQIARSVGNKLASNFSTLIPLLSDEPRRLDVNNSNDLDNEICEAALNAIENLIRKCSNEAKQYIEMIFKLSSHCLVYDPNYNYTEDEDVPDEDMQDEEGEGWGSDFYDDEQDDDDDTAWKVRKSAIKIIDAIIVSCPLQL